MGEPGMILRRNIDYDHRDIGSIRRRSSSPTVTDCRFRSTAPNQPNPYAHCTSCAERRHQPDFTCIQQAIGALCLQSVAGLRAKVGNRA